jgi:riboflavin synthase
VFTGLIRHTGTLLARGDNSLTIEVPADLRTALRTGDSVAVNGVCLTAVRLGDTSFEADLLAATLRDTTLGALPVGCVLNLEPALRAGDPLGGHLVQGHVDGVGRVGSIQRAAEHVLMDIAVPEDVADVTVLHGSIAVDGVSLTVNDIPTDGVIQVALIPHTWEHTNLADLREGSNVNLEGDMIGKFVVAYMKRRGANAI